MGVRLSVLDLATAGGGVSPRDALLGSAELAKRAERWGYGRYWFSEHHNMRSLACSAPELLTAHVGGATSTIRVVSPTRARTSSPGDTMVDGLAGRSLTRTRPPRQAAAASGRVFVSRTAHNQRSTRVDSITSIMDGPPA